MVLTDKEIREYVFKYREHKLQKPLLEGFIESKLQSESYDLTMSDKMMVFKKEIKCISLEDQNAIDNMYEHISISKNGYVISPKEYVLVTLNETINLTDFLTAHIRPRTKFTRLGLIVSDQHCNSTYSGILNLGIFNATEYPIRIESGVNIAQIVFEELISVPSENKLYKNKKNATYQNEKGTRGANFNDEFLKKVDDFVEQILAEED